VAVSLKSEMKKIDRVDVAVIVLLVVFSISVVYSAWFAPPGATWGPVILVLGLVYLIGFRHGQRAQRSGKPS